MEYRSLRSVVHVQGRADGTSYRESIRQIVSHHWFLNSRLEVRKVRGPRHKYQVAVVKGQGRHPDALLLGAAGGADDPCGCGLWGRRGGQGKAGGRAGAKPP